MNYELKIIRSKIRNGSEPNNPKLINEWFNQEDKLLDENIALERHRSIYTSQFNLLLEVVMDELITKHWRLQCLDKIYHPIIGLKKISLNKESELEIRQLLHELSVTTHYVEHSITI